MFLPSHFFHDLGQSSSVLPLEHDYHLGCLATFARRAGFLRLGGPFALGRVLGGGGLLVALPFVGAPLADCVPPLALRAAFGCTDCASGFAVSPRSWMLLPREPLSPPTFRAATPAANDATRGRGRA